jgi:pimeloyl-ACP methyl ester carboxylesterase
LVDHLGLQTIKAIGLSGGGITLLHLATIRPSLLESMIVISAPLTFPERARAIQRHYSPAAVGDAEMARMRQRHRQGESQIEQLFAMVRALADDREDVNFTPEQLARISAKTLIVFGDRDFLYPVSAAFELHRAIKGSYLWVVPNGAHGPVFGDAAPEFVRVALQFLRGGWQ